MQFSIFAVVTFAAAAFTIWLTNAIWSRRPGVGVVAFTIIGIGTTVWTLFSGLELLLTDYLTKMISVQIMYVGIVMVMPAWLVFCLQYTGREQWSTRKRLLLFLIEPILVIVLLLTNDLHHLFYASTDWYMADGLRLLDYSYGPAFWVHTVYSYVLLLTGAGLLLQAFMRSPHLYRGQIRLMLLAIVAPWAANATYIGGLSPFPDYFDLTPLAFVVTGAAIGWSLYRFRLMDVLPVARGTIIDNMNDAIIVLDGRSRVLDINQSALKLLNLSSPDGTIGKPAAEVLVTQAALADQFRETQEIDTEVTAEVAGQKRTFNLRITPLRNRQQELTGRVVTLHDVTTFKEANEQLRYAREKAEEANRLKSEFLATMSHELRTPLNAIIGYTEIQLLGMVGELNPTQQDYQKRVMVNAHQLLQMINSVLDLSKLEAGHIHAVDKSFGLNDWIDDVMEQIAVLGENKRLGFDSEIDPKLPERVVGDADLLRQVIVNLLSNAFKFTKTGKVTLAVCRDDDHHWSIRVSDTGIGIPADKLPYIFDEFYQVDSGATREYGGTGLGLAIVKRLVKTMKGDISVRSIVGEGSTFTVTLPLKPQITPAPQM
ncbi:MAG: PAS domain-containing protein [Anaerolineae bacterium]|nr:PAS domain-containing protein [Anaerolineae bacterium]